MSKYVKGQWPAYNVDYIARNVERCFKTRDLSKLTEASYKFITLQMGFIAHYNRHGFIAVYQGDLQKFARNLVTGEHSRDPEYNLNYASRRERDPWSAEQYGKAYNDSVAQGIRRLVAIAKTYGV